MSKRDPRTKEEFLNRLLSYDFSGDIRDLAIDRNLIIKRAGANVLDLHFPASDQHFQLVVRKPRTEEALERLRNTRANRANKEALSPAAQERIEEEPPPQQHAPPPPRRGVRRKQAA